MSEIVEDVLTHYGKTGMRWNIRKGISPEIGKTSIVAVADKSTHESIMRVAGRVFEKSISSLNAKYANDSKFLSRIKQASSPEAETYRNDVKKAYLSALEYSANTITNSQGSLKYTLKDRGQPNTSQYSWDVSVEEIKHADNPTTTFTVQPIFNEEGLIIGVKMVNNNIAQGEEFITNFLAHISERPWSDYTEADYTLEQWHNACLIHQHQGPPTSKSQCKLPVKTPNGALNRNGVHAAAAALAGARTELKATPEEKSKAAAALRRYYSELGETPPASLAQSTINGILEYYGDEKLGPFDR